VIKQSQTKPPISAYEPLVVWRYLTDVKELAHLGLQDSVGASVYFNSRVVRHVHVSYGLSMQLLRV